MNVPGATPTANPTAAVQVHGWCGCEAVVGRVAVSIGIGVVLGLVMP